MKQISTLAAIFILAVPAAFSQPCAHTFVSHSGSNTATCGLQSSPCASFQVAVKHTALGGELDALDAGDFGPVNITQAITIDGGPGVAGISLPALSDSSCLTAGAICVAPSAAGAAIVLRSISINLTVLKGLGNYSGVQVYAASGAGPNVVAENIQVTNPSGDCVDVFGGSLVMRNSNLRNCGAFGVEIVSPSPATLENLVITNSGTGIGVIASNATIRNCNLSGNTEGIYVSGSANATVDSSQVSQNGTGLVSVSSAITQLTNSTVTFNDTGMSSSGGGAIVSFVNNRICGNNGANGLPTSSVYQK